ncbi:hypothetical protein MUK42_36438 [Musa troglodytarum]|uniref:Uncharacterized protein n=1 Tax=Musa troglodytarum TaxID=320322 RepID=A0A9E7E9H1_9LILI|nr:hypothetical protein MUK42_36438 [Musa troglodytarum]
MVRARRTKVSPFTTRSGGTSSPERASAPSCGDHISPNPFP